MFSFLCDLKWQWGFKVQREMSEVEVGEAKLRILGTKGGMPGRRV